MRHKKSSRYWLLYTSTIQHGIDLKEVVDLFQSSTQGDLSLAALLKDRDDS